MKKLILFLVPLLLIQSMAFADTANGLKTLIDDYRYNVTVEWDQKDQAALREIQAEFHQEVKALNVSLEDIRAAVKTEDAEIANVLNQKNESAMAEELQKLIDTRSHEMYAQGASWSPGAVFAAGLGVLLVLEIIVLAMKNSDCPGNNTAPEGVRYDCVWP